MGEMTPSPVTIDHLAEQMHKYMRRSHALAWALFASLLMLSAALGLIYKLSAERITHETAGFIGELNPVKWKCDLCVPPIPLDPPRAVNVPGRIAGPNPCEPLGISCSEWKP